MKKIPSKIHYCWFGGKEKPEAIKDYIETWKRNLPDFELIEWNEQNFDLSSAPVYVQEAYQVKKYAFVSDYVRIKALYEQGGIYFDTDVEVVKPLNPYLQDISIVLGFESERTLTTAVIACIPGHPFFKQFLDTYEDRKFINPDGSIDLSTINFHFSSHAEAWGVVLEGEKYQKLGEDIVIYPTEVFCGFDVKNWHVRRTENTVTIHHMNSSWVPFSKQVYFGVILILQKILGLKGYDRFKYDFDRLKRFVSRQE